MQKDKHKNKLRGSPFSGVSSHSSRSLRESGVLRKHTRKNRRTTKKYVYGKNSKRSRKYRRQMGGLDKSDEDQINDLKNIISKYIETEKKKPTLSPKYKNNEAYITTYLNTIVSKDVSDLTDEELAIIQKLAITIIDEYSGMNILQMGGLKLYKLLNQVILYFLNDVEVVDNIELTFRKRTTNNMPYLSFIHTKNGYETKYDVNEMFALIKSEMDTNTYGKNLKKSFLKKLKFNSKMGLEDITPPTTAPATATGPAVP